MHVEASDVVRQVEAKYPALLFKQQLTAYVEKIYGIVRDNIKRELSSLISLCIQVTYPRSFIISYLCKKFIIGVGPKYFTPKEINGLHINFFLSI